MIRVSLRIDIEHAGGSELQRLAVGELTRVSGIQEFLVKVTGDVNQTKLQLSMGYDDDHRSSLTSACCIFLTGLSRVLRSENFHKLFQISDNIQFGVLGIEKNSIQQPQMIQAVRDSLKLALVTTEIDVTDLEADTLEKRIESPGDAGIVRLINEWFRILLIHYAYSVGVRNPDFRKSILAYVDFVTEHL